MDDVLIRPPKPDEAEELADLHVLTWRETYSGAFPPSAWGEEARSQRLAMWDAICPRPCPADRFAVAERNGTLIGFAGSGASMEDPRAFYERNGFVLDGARQATGFDTGGEEVRMLR